MYDNWLDHYRSPPPQQPTVRAAKKPKSGKAEKVSKSLSTKSLFLRKPKKQADQQQREDSTQRASTPQLDMTDKDSAAKQPDVQQDASNIAYESHTDNTDQLPRELALRASSEYSTDLVNGKRATYVEHHRSESLHVNWSLEEVKRMADEIYEGTIADVHLSLLGYWIRERIENYGIAKAFIRELALDQGYNVERERNVHLRQLLRDVVSVRPKEARAAIEVRPSLRVQRDAVLEDSELPSPASPTRNYPPNTPDRPAPLTVSVRSQTSNSTPTTTYRSLSSPIGSEGMLRAIPFPRNTLIIEDAASHPLLAVSADQSVASSSQPGTDDVFGIAEGDLHDRGPLTAVRTSHGSTALTLGRRYASTSHNAPVAQGYYKLCPSDAVSRTSYEGATSLHSIAVGESAHDQELEIDVGAEDDAFNIMHSYAGSSSMSVLESATTDSVKEGQTPYSYAPRASVAEQVGSQAATRTSEQRLASHGPRKISGPNPLTTVTSFHRPLPLRRYESEAHLYPTSRARGASTHNRANSAGSMLRGGRPVPSLAVDPMPRLPTMQSAILPVTPYSIRGNSILFPSRAETASRHSHPGNINQAAQVGEFDGRLMASASDTPRRATNSQATTLANFPIPPIQNPVGELPMTTIRVLTGLDAATVTGELAEAYRTVAADVERIRVLLGRTRTRGEQLGSVNWQTLPPFERTWREVNEDLLISIYGRQDTELTPGDVQYVDIISRELRKSLSARWVHELFCEDIEMF